MKTALATLLETLSSKPPEAWPRANRHAVAMQHGSLYVEPYAPVGVDLQIPHA